MGGGKKRRQRGPQHLSSTVRLERRTLWTQNAVEGKAVYGESLRRFSGKEHRRWDPTRSKLGRECFEPTETLVSSCQNKVTRFSTLALDTELR